MKNIRGCTGIPVLFTFYINTIMKKNKYDVTALAVQYFPDSTEANARRRFFKVLRAERDLWQRLADLHFGPWQRTFTPRQYEMVIDILGRPDAADEDYADWPR